MGVKLSISMIFIIFILGIIVEARVIAKMSVVEKEDSPPSSSSESSEYSVDEVCQKISNASSCTKNFGAMAQKKENNKATVTLYLNEGVQMARDELKKAHQVSVDIGEKSCARNIEQAMDKLGEGKDPSSGDSDANLFFSDALTDTTTCLDELEMANKDKVKPMEDSLSLARELLHNLISISHHFGPPAPTPAQS